jgi:AcrR family transcriptional regulator
MKTKKELILDAAASLFAEQGFDKTPVATICELANVSKGLVYHHFKSKDEILIEIFERSTSEMSSLSEDDNHEISEMGIVDLIENIFFGLENNRQFFQMNLNIMFQPSTRKILERQIKERATQLFNSVKALFNKTSTKKSEILSYVFISEIDGIALSYLSSFENYPLKEMKEQLIQKYKND